MYDLENEYQNELLASVDIEHPVNNSTNYTMLESEISEQVTDENTEPANSNIKINQRFVNMSSAKFDEIIKKAETKNTKENTKWAVRVFKVSFMTFYAVKTQTRLLKHSYGTFSC